LQAVRASFVSALVFLCTTFAGVLHRAGCCWPSVRLCHCRTASWNGTPPDPSCTDPFSSPPHLQISCEWSRSKDSFVSIPGPTGHPHPNSCTADVAAGLWADRRYTTWRISYHRLEMQIVKPDSGRAELLDSKNTAVPSLDTTATSGGQDLDCVKITSSSDRVYL